MFKFLLALALFAPVAHADTSVPRSKQYLWFAYDTAQSGGASIAHPMGVALPGPGIITNMWVYINTQFAASGTESLGISCAGSQDLMAYSSIKSITADKMLAARISGATFDGTAAPISAAPTVVSLNTGFVSVPTNCNVVVDVRGASGFTPYTSGKLTGIVEYFRF